MYMPAAGSATKTGDKKQIKRKNVNSLDPTHHSGLSNQLRIVLFYFNTSSRFHSTMKEALGGDDGNFFMMASDLEKLYTL
jgi:hypothetical protein